MLMRDEEVLDLFSKYIRLTGVSSLAYQKAEEPYLQGKRLGIINGSSWITLWSTYFGNRILPGVKLINVGNEAQQLNFMRAHSLSEQCPPLENIQKTCNYARDLCELCKPDMILLTCSTMNRAQPYVIEAVKEYNVPVIQIDEPMMEKAVNVGSHILIIATHGPTVNRTRMLLEETALRMGKKDSISYRGATIESAFDLLGEGKVREHNREIELAIQAAKKEGPVDCVVLAQISMSLFCIEHRNVEEDFGCPVLCSGIEGFNRIREMFKEQYEGGK